MGKKFRKIIFDKSKKLRIVGYGAPAKGNTLLNFCGLNHTHLDYIIDDAPAKQGRFTPGSRIPIRGMPQKIDADYILILAWNYAQPIMDKLSSAGYKGKYIIPLPEPVVSK